jgi:16S rRNA (cytosine1402-N4)-methyltransferase
MNHIPVLLKEVLEYLDIKPGENFIDCTIGLGGHTFHILERNKPKGRVLGIELDKVVLEQLRKTNLEEERLILAQGNFIDLKKIVEKHNFKPVQGILFDLGMSSWQIEESGRGFSFQKDEPLDMRVESANNEQRTTNNVLTSEEIINEWPEEELVRIFREYGEEKYAKKIARRIIEERKKQKVTTTKQLVDIIVKIVPRKKIHPATKVFQALRIAVNDELNNLKKALPQALEILRLNGRLVVISFHSLEDRIVKNFFREQAKKGSLKILTKKPISPSLEEIKLNPRSRSAKLRAAVKQ